MAARLTPDPHLAESFDVEIGGITAAAHVYRDAATCLLCLTADASRFQAPADLPAPFRRWTYEFAALPELCAFLGAPLPASESARLAA